MGRLLAGGWIISGVSPNARSNRAGAPWACCKSGLKGKASSAVSKDCGWVRNMLYYLAKSAKYGGAWRAKG